MRVAVIMAVLLLAGCSPAKQSAAPEKAKTSGETVAELLKQAAALDEACHGNGDDPKTLQACDKQEPVAKKLNAAGWCFGPTDLPMYQQKWGLCPTGQRKSALYAAAHPDDGTPSEVPVTEPQGSTGAEPSDEVHFDRGDAIRDYQMQQYMGAAESCMHIRAEALFYAGVKSRAQLKSQVYATCTRTLVQALQAVAGESASDAETGARGMVDRAVEEVLAQYGA